MMTHVGTPAFQAFDSDSKWSAMRNEHRNLFQGRCAQLVPHWKEVLLFEHDASRKIRRGIAVGIEKEAFALPVVHEEKVTVLTS